MHTEATEVTGVDGTDGGHSHCIFDILVTHKGSENNLDAPGSLDEYDRCGSKGPHKVVVLNNLYMNLK